MRLLQGSLVVLFIALLSLVVLVVASAQNGSNPEPGIYINKGTGIALSVVVVLIGAIAALAFKAGYGMRKQEELERRIEQLERQVKSDD